MSDGPIVILVDDDAELRRSLSLVLGLSGYRTVTYPSAEALLQELDVHCDELGCIVLDLRMPEMNGLELQEALHARECLLPVIFITAFGDVPASVQALKGGAVDFLEKPFATESLLARIDEAVEVNGRLRARVQGQRETQERVNELTPREREVLQHVTAGLSNKEIARELDISPRTVEKYRARMMEKMQAESIAELCQMSRDGEARGVGLRGNGSDAAE
ncbi:response regulator [Thioalkalivibrio sp.]|uniref:response regulator transcription factor n=1 Tax=Thioalkalivibrio sp. TaxID=2093813 RepID=UPI0012D56C58|nr:response regulator [Thioalkalivibrio sp.]TVP83130.1 MAG: DNA-binding response regulator [Thioalkalivibrio sp.]